jgi:hypothetical protein
MIHCASPKLETPDPQSEIAVPVLFDLIVHHWKRFTTAEMDQLLKGLEYYLWCAGSEPTYVLVEQLRRFPELRQALRRMPTVTWARPTA